MNIQKDDNLSLRSIRGDNCWIGQKIILVNSRPAYDVDAEKYPLTKYPVGSVFTIVKKRWDKDDCSIFWLTLEDAECRRFTLGNDRFGSTNGGDFDLYDYRQWTNFKKKCA